MTTALTHFLTMVVIFSLLVFLAIIVVCPRFRVYGIEHAAIAFARSHIKEEANAVAVGKSGDRE